MKKRERKERKVEYLRHKEEIEQEYKKKLGALYTLYPEFQLPTVASVTTNGTRGKLANLVRQAISKKDGQFGMRDMAQWITEIDKSFAASVTNVQLSNTLARLANKGELERVANSSPIAYRKKSKPGALGA